MGDWRKPTSAERESIEQALLALANNHAEISDHAVRIWASVTFAGARHRMTVRFRGEEAVRDGELFLAYLPEHEFALRSKLVADAAVTGVTRNAGEYLGATIELLVLSEGA